MTSKLIRMGNLIQPAKESRFKGKVLLDLTRKEAPSHWVPRTSHRTESRIHHRVFHHDWVTKPDQLTRPGYACLRDHERQGGKYVTQGRQYHRGPSIY